MEKKPTPRAVALLPVAVFLVLYLVLGIILEYVLKIEMGFYQIPIVVAFLVALLVACLQNRGLHPGHGPHRHRRRCWWPACKTAA